MTIDKNSFLTNYTQKKPHLTRRQFIKSTAAGAAAIYMMPSLALSTKTQDNDNKSRVVNIRHAGLINPDERVNSKNARQSVDKALVLLTQKENLKDAWIKIFPNLNSQDTIGLKVNCVNRKCPTHPEIAYAIADSIIESLGINPNNIIIWDRSISELKKCGYTINESDKGIQCFGTVKAFSGMRWMFNQKMDETGAIGYDKTRAIDVGDGVTSHLSNILTQKCTYLINVPVLKDHGKAGITLSLKNHFGSIDNPTDCHDNLCEPFISRINADPQIKEKTRLIICDAAYGVYDGGPLGAPQWQHKSILGATDPVALDFTGMQVINSQRKLNKLDPVTKMATHLVNAQNLGLGTCDPNNIQVIDSALT
ncbi:MAG: DUF362 domain-containing protein [Desulfobacteraceae bacterium]|nr:DUF362 domain-containing protein [Desulfobacteraceae bacterium]